ncbi:MAG: penicillin-binding protein 2 [Actinomycetota bacterium]
MDRQIRRLGIALIVLFVMLFAQINYIQVFAAEDLINNPANARRLIIQQFEVDRGDILARDGTVLATSVPTGGELKFLRRYPERDLTATATGYSSLIYGNADLEKSYDPYLSARDESLIPVTLIDQILGRPKRGATVVTTIDPKLQEVATRALGGAAGAVAAIDPRSGDVLALVSVPSYDPSDLSSHNPKEIRRTWDQLNKDKDKPLLSKANEELYPPGSTFKLITATAALENGYSRSSRWPNPPEIDLPLTTNTLQNFGGTHCAGGASSISLEQAFTESCNVTFAEIGLKLGAKRLLEQARAYGFDQDVPFDVPFEEGHFPEVAHFEEADPLLAFAAVGQDDVSSNPLQMALVASAIANGGVMPRPRLVTEVRAPEGGVLKSFGPAAHSTAMSPKTAADMTRMMISVVNGGTGTSAQIPGIQVAGKTGTAQHGDGENPHAWFVSFAPAEKPEIAVAVVVFDGGDLGSEATGGAVAAPIARDVIEAALR